MRLLSFIGLVAIIGVVAAAIYFFGGYYSVAATQPEPDLVSWGLGHVREASISRHAIEQPPRSLDEAAVVQAGARAFASRGCANCHGAPGVAWAKFSEGLRPDPPNLKDVAGEISAEDVFWVVKNGINMTGMPAFARIAADDNEIWSIAAFVKKLPTVSDADYKAWTAAQPAAPPTDLAPLAPPPAGATPGAQ